MQYDVIIAGAGITGLSTAWKLIQQRPSLRLLLLEKESAVCLHQTGNNSGVIHSGIYYKPGSLKARTCVDGYRQLLAFADQYKIPYEITGKIIVALTMEEIPRLDSLYQRGLQNGLEGLKKLSGDEIKEYEPHVRGIEALWVPQTGITDYRKIGEKMAELILHSGAHIHYNEELVRVKKDPTGIRVRSGSMEYQTRMLVNTCGLFSDRVAKLAGIDPQVRIIPFRGEYYKLKPEKEYLVRNLVYPVPDPDFPFLGVHFTRMARGGVEAGPNAVLAFKREGYRKSDFSWADSLESLKWRGFRKVIYQYAGMGIGEFYRSFSKSAFTTALQKLIPEITSQDLIPGGSGVRAQACDVQGKLLDDFLFADSPGIINVLNAPSPAATASLAIGDHICSRILNQLS